MSISSTARKAGPYNGNGITVAFPFAFKVFSAADVLVVKTTPAAVESTLVLTTDYTVSLNADQDSNPGGTVTAVSAPASGTLLTITSAVENLQPVSLSNNGGFYPKVINDALDRLTILVQQVAEKSGRALTLPISGGGSGALPGPSAGSFIGWDSLGQNLVNYVGIAGAAVSTFMATVVSSANASAARTALGAVGTSDVQVLSNKSLDATCSLDGNAATSTTAGAIADGAVSSAAKITDNIVTPEKLTQPFTTSSVVPASGLSIDFLSIPTWVKKITINLSGISTNGSSNIQVQLGDAGGLETTGYLGSSSGMTVSAVASANFTSGAVFGNAWVPSIVVSGSIVISLIDPATNMYSITGILGRHDAAGTFVFGYTKSTSQDLTDVRITSGNGSDTFDSGSVNFMYEG